MVNLIRDLGPGVMTRVSNLPNGCSDPSLCPGAVPNLFGKKSFLKVDLIPDLVPGAGINHVNKQSFCQYDSTPCSYKRMTLVTNFSF